MAKCQHPDCPNKANVGLCEGHRELIQRPDHCVLICYCCGGLVSVFLRPMHVSPAKKYFFCTACRNCGGTKEDELAVLKQL